MMRLLSSSRPSLLWSLQCASHGRRIDRATSPRAFAATSRSSEASVDEEEAEKRCTHNAISQQLSAYFEVLRRFHESRTEGGAASSHVPTTSEVTKEHFGFALVKRRSTIPNAGFGLFVEGVVEAGRCMCVYPGVVYQPGDPLFFPSLWNDYLIRRSDGASVDGRYWALSKYMFDSIRGQHGPNAKFVCDRTWLSVTENSHVEHNPFGWGHLINHNRPANVMYFEYQFPEDADPRHAAFVPNIYYAGATSERVKTIVLVSLRRLCDEELFSNYNFVGK